jgi:hypothetical protein
MIVHGLSTGQAVVLGAHCAVTRAAHDRGNWTHRAVADAVHAADGRRSCIRRQSGPMRSLAFTAGATEVSDWIDGPIMRSSAACCGDPVLRCAMTVPRLRGERAAQPAHGGRDRYAASFRSHRAGIGRERSPGSGVVAGMMRASEAISAPLPGRMTWSSCVPQLFIHLS